TRHFLKPAGRRFACATRGNTATGSVAMMHEKAERSPWGKLGRKEGPNRREAYTLQWYVTPCSVFETNARRGPEQWAYRRPTRAVQQK
ncbi:MAG: hypothetical protein V2B18_04635, partial [Pseudomonadota bacterium]